MNLSFLELDQLANAQWEAVEKAKKEAEEGKDSEYYEFLYARYERQVSLWEKVIRFKNAQ